MLIIKNIIKKLIIIIINVIKITEKCVHKNSYKNIYFLKKFIVLIQALVFFIKIKNILLYINILVFKFYNFIKKTLSIFYTLYVVF